MNTGTQSAIVTAIAVPLRGAKWPSASDTRSHPSHAPSCSTTRVPCTCEAVAKRGNVMCNDARSASHRPITSRTDSSA